MTCTCIGEIGEDVARDTKALGWAVAKEGKCTMANDASDSTKLEEAVHADACPIDFKGKS